MVGVPFLHLTRLVQRLTGVYLLVERHSNPCAVQNFKFAQFSTQYIYKKPKGTWAFLLRMLKKKYIFANNTHNLSLLKTKNANRVS